jgi:hypothetical protein
VTDRDRGALWPAPSTDLCVVDQVAHPFAHPMRAMGMHGADAVD